MNQLPTGLDWVRRISGVRISATKEVDGSTRIGERIFTEVPLEICVLGAWFAFDSVVDGVICYEWVHPPVPGTVDTFDYIDEVSEIWIMAERFGDNMLRVGTKTFEHRAWESDDIRITDDAWFGFADEQEQGGYLFRCYVRVHPPIPGRPYTEQQRRGSDPDPLFDEIATILADHFVSASQAYPACLRIERKDGNIFYVVHPHDPEAENSLFLENFADRASETRYPDNFMDDDGRIEVEVWDAPVVAALIKEQINKTEFIKGRDH